jgi:fimbrial chaperone protein
MHARRFFAALAALLAVTSLPVQAGLFSVSPVRIYMGARERAVAVTVTNEGDTELVMQADIYDWKQKADGSDDLTLSEEMILAPPILKLAPKSHRVLRLALTRPAPQDAQLTYRLVVREIPEAKRPEKGVQLQIALAFSLPVFVTPQSAKRQLECSVERASATVMRAVCENRGKAYAQPVDFTLTSAAGHEIASHDKGGYILPGVKRGFELDAAKAAIAPGPARLRVTQDDGQQQTFDVTISE